jgi:SWI/SNF-related matrix-associated actin-dependent regulator of chromatin subfamily A member 5
MSMGKVSKSSGPRLSKIPQLHDFQFFNTTRLTEIYEKDHAYEIYKHQMSQKEAAARAQGASEEVVQAQLVPGPDDPTPLSEKEVCGFPSAPLSPIIGLPESTT